MGSYFRATDDPQKNKQNIPVNSQSASLNKLYWFTNWMGNEWEYKTFNEQMRQGQQIAAPSLHRCSWTVWKPSENTFIYIQSWGEKNKKSREGLRI